MKRLHILFLVLTVIGLAVAFRLIQSSHERKLFDLEKEKIRQAGQPATLEELNEFYRIPESEKDSTALWLKVIPFRDEDLGAFQTALDLPHSLDSSGKFDWDSTGISQESIDDFLGRSQVQIDLLLKAAQSGGSARYRIDCREGPALRFVHAEGIRTAILALTTKARLLARGSSPENRLSPEQSEAVFRLLQAALATADSIQHEPFLLSLTVRLSGHMIVAEELPTLTPRATFSQEQIQELQDRFRGYDYAPGLRRAIAGEQAVTVAMITGDFPLDFGDWSSSWGLGSDDNWGTAAGIESLRAYLAYNRQAIEILGGNEADWKKGLSSLAQRFADRELYPTELLPLLDPLVERVLATRTKNRLLDLALGIDLFYRERQRLPAELAELVPRYLPTLPKNPFTGESFRYEAKEKEYLLDGTGNGSATDKETLLIRTQY